MNTHNNARLTPKGREDMVRTVAQDRRQMGRDGIWLVTFIDYDLGYIDLEQTNLQPIDNPFGPRLSPMS